MQEIAHRARNVMQFPTPANSSHIHYTLLQSILLKDFFTGFMLNVFRFLVWLMLENHCSTNVIEDSKVFDFYDKLFIFLILVHNIVLFLCFFCTLLQTTKLLKLFRIFKQINFVNLLYWGSIAKLHFSSMGWLFSSSNTQKQLTVVMQNW